MKNKEIKLQLLIGWESSIYEMGYDISKITKEKKEQLELAILNSIKKEVDLNEIIKIEADKLEVPKVIKYLPYTMSLSVSSQILIASESEEVNETYLNQYTTIIEDFMNEQGFVLNDIAFIKDEE